MRTTRCRRVAAAVGVVSATRVIVRSRAAAARPWVLAGAALALAAFPIARAAAQTPGANCADPLVVTVPAQLPYFNALSVCGLGNDAPCLGTSEDAVYKLVVTEPVCLRVVVTGGPTRRFYVGSTCPPCGAAGAVEQDGVSLAVGEHFIVVKSPTCDTTLRLETCPLRPCCLITGDCAMLNAAECAAVGGVVRELGATCASVRCPEPYTCCLPDGGCQAITVEACWAAGGARLWGVECSAGLCGPKSCCLPNGTCSDATMVRDCLQLSGTPLIDGGTCATTPCNMVCLRGDVNCDGRVDNFDIDPFVLALVDGSAPLPPPNWVFGEGCWAIRSCSCDINRDAGFNGFDVDPFISCMVVLPPVGQECSAP